jgi:catechol 2,3-dioxygenase-like lactoylglutathione lyase family enzyme
MTLFALDHVQIAIPAGSEQEALGFYVGVLGFAEVERPASLAGRGGCWLEAGAAKLHLGVDPAFHPAAKAHPAFLVEDVAELERRVVAAGFRTQRDVPLPGYDRVHVFDPFGNRVELMQRLS